jgi:hypothetical protein
MVEEMLAARGILVSHKTVRQWALKFGQTSANQILRRLPIELPALEHPTPSSPVSAGHSPARGKKELRQSRRMRSPAHSEDVG